MSALDFYRAQAVEASRQMATAATAAIRERCRISAEWWTRVADALEAGNLPDVAVLTDQILPFHTGDAPA